MLRKILFFVGIHFFCWSETVSIIVPCYYKHFHLLPELLHNLSLQTVLPDEVVISVSEEDKIDGVQKALVTNGKYPFKVKFLFHKERKFAGENRNCACEQAVGDIFITQDSDDIPHPQRVEIIKRMFEKFQIFHLMHKFIDPYQQEGSKIRSYSFSKIRTFMMRSNYMKECWVFGPLTNGEMAIRRQVFDKVKWSTLKTGEDVQFNTDVVTLFKKTLIIDAPLVVYRRHLSSNLPSSRQDKLQQRYRGT